MHINVNLKITVKSISKEVLLLGTDAMKDCLKILFVEGLKSKGYDCEISDIIIEELICYE